MSRYPAVYQLLRERMSDEHDIPDTDEIIAATLDVAHDAVAALLVDEDGWDQHDEWMQAASEAIDALRGDA